jgi:hypothetical protein
MEITRIYSSIQPTSIGTKIHNSKITDLVQKCEASNQVCNVYCSSETDCNLSVRYVILTLDQKL